MKNKLYILTDKTLDPIYAAVQGGHCIYEFIKKFPNIWNNEYLIYLSVDINKWYCKLRRFDPNHFQWAYFNEPDLDNKMTAIAVYENDFPSFITRKLKSEKLLSMEGN